MRKVLIAGVSAVSIATGSAAIALAVPGGIANAQDSGSTTTTPERSARAGRVLDGALAALVEDGTLTQQQADAVRAKVGEVARERVGKAKAAIGATLDEIASYLGTDAATLREQLRTRSLGDIAGDKRDGLVAMLTEKANARIDELVSSGRITSERAEALKAKVPERIAKLVDAVGGKGSAGHRAGGFGGGRGGR